MDGTLLGSDGHVSARNRAAVLEAERQGIEIVIATGRRHAYAMRVLHELGLHSANALISSNGTVIRTVGAELLHRSYIPLETARWLCDAVHEFRNTFVLTFDNVDANGEEARGALVCEETDTLYESIGGWMRNNEPYMIRVPRMEHVLDSLSGNGSGKIDAPIQAMVCGPVDVIERAEVQLARHAKVAGVGQPEFPGCEIALHRTVYPARNLAILDILPAGCSKASALAHLAELRGCTMAEVLAIGDNWNDVPMLEAAGEAVLMGNAPEDLRRYAEQHGWTVGPTNDEDGVAVALEAVLRGQGPGASAGLELQGR